MGDHSLILKEGRREIGRQNVYNTQASLEETSETLPTMDACHLRCGTKTGAWMSVLPSIVNGAYLGA